MHTSYSPTINRSLDKVRETVEHEGRKMDTKDQHEFYRAVGQEASNWERDSKLSSGNESSSSGGNNPGGSGSKH